MREGFARGVSDLIGWYVYLLIDPRDQSVFYVGKGNGNRCFAHVAEARTSSEDVHGDYEKLALIRSIEATDKSVVIEVLRHDLTEPEALLVESSVIDLLRLKQLANRVAGHGTSTHGRMSVEHINGLYGSVPVEIDPNHAVVLINIRQSYWPGIDEAELYEKPESGGRLMQGGSNRVLPVRRSGQWLSLMV